MLGCEARPSARRFVQRRRVALEHQGSSRFWSCVRRASARRELLGQLRQRVQRVGISVAWGKAQGA